MEIKFRIDKQKQGSFYIEQDGRQVAELDFEIQDNLLNALHTGVRPELEGQGIAGRLFDEMIEYAHENNYKVIATCPYIKVMFKRNSPKLDDIQHL